MGAIHTYLERDFTPDELEDELTSLIRQYNALTGKYLFIYCSAISKGQELQDNIALQQEDYFYIHDLLCGLDDNINKLDFYIETPGGSGETAEEIVRFLHNKFPGEVNCIVAGEAKSAGTLVALGCNNIMMTETGSLGPIDAQVFLGRTFVSAHDYMEWVKMKQKESEDKNSINPFDATIVAQISPGEIGEVSNALEFAIDIVEEWLCKYKFKNWTQTQTSKSDVTPEMRKIRAHDIATKLTNHSEWRSHGRSLKIEDLEKLGLQIDNIDHKPEVAKIIYNIKALLMLLFEMTDIFKIFVNETSSLKRYIKPKQMTVDALQ